MKKQKSKNKSAKLKIVNFKVTQATLDAIDKKAKELTKGNRSRLLVMAALNRKTPFVIPGKADGTR